MQTDQIRYRYGCYHICIHFCNANTDTDRKIIYPYPQKTDMDTEWIKETQIRIKTDMKMDIMICIDVMEVIRD